MKLRNIIRLRSITVDIHGWTRPSYGADLLDAFVVLGFITIWVSQRRMVDRLVELRGAIKKLTGGGK